MSVRQRAQAQAVLPTPRPGTASGRPCDRGGVGAAAGVDDRQSPRTSRGGDRRASRRRAQDHVRDRRSLVLLRSLDRQLPGGGTPVERFAELSALDDTERAAVRTLTQARLGLWRVRAVEPGLSIDLEEVVGDRVVSVHSQNVSRGTARWDVLLGRVIEGAPDQELWGPAAIFTAAEEEEIVTEVERLADERSIPPSAVFQSCAAEDSCASSPRAAPSRRASSRSRATRSWRRMHDGSSRMTKRPSRSSAIPTS